MVSTHKKLYKNVDIATWQNRQYLSESHKTQNQRFGSLLINADLAFDFALKGTLCEGAGSAMFFAETEGELLCLAWEPRQIESAAKAAEEPKVNSPSPRFVNRVPQTGQRYKSSQGYQKSIQ